MFKPIQNQRVYQQVVAQIHKLIFEGELKAGDRLPPEQDLVDQLNVSRTSVREALRALEVTGLIELQEAGGYIISGVINKSLLDPLAAIFMLNKGTPADVLEIRNLIEVNSARLAAERITDDQIIELQRILDKLGKPTLEEHKAKIDAELHYYIAEITGNILIISVLNIISSIMERFIQTSRSKIIENQNNQAMLFRHHEDIVAAICDRDPDRSAEAMSKHMVMINKIVFEND